jgi:protein-S-isoprenylcysteine O-methyltransferase Ste14
MTYIAIGVLGFVCFLLFDIFSMRNRVVLKYMSVLTGVGLIAYSSTRLVGLPSDLVFPSFVQGIALVHAVIFMCLLIYSVFIEVGLKTYQTYAEPSLVTDGTYSLVRHPGVIWLFLAYFFGAIYYANSYVLLTAFIWTTVNTIYIIIQERYILIHLFDGYEQYRRTTPMVIPNSTSLKRFITIENWRKE